MRAYDDWIELGELPEQGGTLDQPAIWHVWRRVIGSAFRAADNERG